MDSEKHVLAKAGRGEPVSADVGDNGGHEPDAEAAVYRHALEQLRTEFQAFAYSISHDLRAPLRAIEGFSKILLEDYSKDIDPEAQRFLGHITTNAQLLSSQIEDLLRFYRAGKNPPTKIEVETSELLREVMAQFTPQIGKDVTIEIQKPMPKVLADPIQLREIFSHLIGNALKFTAKTPKPRIEIGAKTEPQSTTFFVKDNGAGYDPKNSDRLFQVFQRLHSTTEFPGNGIGLSIVKRLVQGHGGCVAAEGSPGAGAAFSFTLPNRITPPETSPA